MNGFRKHLAATQAEPARIAICRGPPKCEGQPQPCAWCYVVESDDPRSSEEILEAASRDH